MGLVINKNNIGIGKRKQSTARVFLIPGTGSLTINKTSGANYLQYNSNYLNIVWAPLKQLNLDKLFIIILVKNLIILYVLIKYGIYRGKF